MIFLFLVLLILSLLATAVTWLAEYPGTVTMTWLDWQIETSIAFLLFATLIALFVLWTALSLLRRLFQSPQNFRNRRLLRHYSHGISALTVSMAALTISNAHLAKIYSRKAQKYLGQSAATHLLSAQIAKLEGDNDKMESHLESLLNYKETEFLAARSLCELAIKSDKITDALPFAKRASDLQPKDTQAQRSLVSVYCQTRQYEDALELIHKMRFRAFTRPQARRLEGIVRYAQAERFLHSHNNVTALEHAYQAQKLLSSVPSALLLSHAYIATGDEQAAIKVAQQMWKQSPHPALTHLVIDTLPEVPTATLKRIQKMAAIHPTHTESHLAMATVALRLRQWELARTHLKKIVSRQDTKRVCTLMADLERGQYDDHDAAAQWLMRASNASPDPTWVCEQCGTEHTEWHVHCPTCNAFDRIEWKQHSTLSPTDELYLADSY